MSDLIYRHDAIKAIETSRFLIDAKEKVMMLPSAQPKTGKWERTFMSVTKDRKTSVVKCSECGCLQLIEYPFCGGCGAKMEGEDHV